MFSSYAEQLTLGQPPSAVSIATAPSQLVLTRYGKCVDSSGGSSNPNNVEQAPCLDGPSQAFRLIPTGDSYEIRHDASGQCVTVEGRGDSNWTSVTLADCFREAHQLWKVQDLPNTSDESDFMLVNQGNNKCLDLSEGNSADGANIHMWSCSSSNSNQRLRQRVLPNEQGLELSAAAARVFGAFERKDDYIAVPHNNHAIHHSISETRAEFELAVTQAGSYQIEGEVQATNGNNDSFWVRIDGAPSSAYLWDTGVRGSFQWVRVRPRAEPHNVAVHFDPGPHTVTVYVREDDTRLRRLRLVPVE